MRVIHKFPLAFPLTHFVARNPKVLHVEVQHGTPCFWAEVDDSGEAEEYIIRHAGTGHMVPENSEYIGTFMQDPYVWHLYMEKK